MREGADRDLGAASFCTASTFTLTNRLSGPLNAPDPFFRLRSQARCVRGPLERARDHENGYPHRQSGGARLACAEMAAPHSQPAAGSSLAPSDSDGSPRSAGGFRIHEEVGRGGMGVVYRAEEIASGRIVALKSISPGFACTPDALQRFHREARLTASISHPNCVFVYGAHEIDGAPVIAMEWMDGGTLRAGRAVRTSGARAPERAARTRTPGDWRRRSPPRRIPASRRFHPGTPDGSWSSGSPPGE